MALHDKVKCYTCGKEVYEQVETIEYGDLIEPGQSKGINGYPSPDSGKMICCPACGDGMGIKLGLEETTGHELIP